MKEKGRRRRRKQADKTPVTGRSGGENRRGGNSACWEEMERSPPRRQRSEGEGSRSAVTGPEEKDEADRKGR